MPVIRITYEIVTPESAADGDVSERGWVDEDGTAYTTDEAIQFLAHDHSVEPSSTQFHPGVWYSDLDAETDWHTGAERRQSYHLKGFTESQQRRIYRAVTHRR